MRFEIKDINELKGADYNPRIISKKSFLKLQESLKKFGVCKPVIANKNGILIAGHQRTKAMKEVGIKEVPVYILDTKIAIHDEIRFNLMHNSIETENSKAYIKNGKHLDYGYTIIHEKDIDIKEYNNGSTLKEICSLLIKYGEWGSVIINENGNIIHNNDYAVCCKKLNLPCLVYKMNNDNAKLFLEYMKVDYGRYDYEALGIKAYNQTHCQMSRNGKIHSRLYERYVMPNINKNQRIVDFGAGKKEYATRLRHLGYKTFAYEPHLKKVGTENLNVKQVVKDIYSIQKDISKNGLYDVVILDSVLNSITSLEFEHMVMVTCNSLMNENGIFYTGTRNLKSAEMERDVSRDQVRYIQFLDNDKFGATFRKGVWTMQKFNSAEMLKNLCEKYFNEVKVIDNNVTQLFAICRKPKKLSIDEYKRCLDTEFNMEYPNGYKHNKHELIVKTILEKLEGRNENQ